MWCTKHQTSCDRENRCEPAVTWCSGHYVGLPEVLFLPNLK